MKRGFVLVLVAAVAGGAVAWTARAGDGKSVEERLASIEQRMTAVEARLARLAPIPAAPKPAAGPAAPSAPEPKGITVYTTKTGSKYHRAGCSYLKSSIPISLAEAKARGLGPCSRCNPPP
jgi:hypothetical protein